MNAPPAPQPPELSPSPAPLRPNWTGILRALWIFTWKTQTATRRLPGLALILLGIPILTFVTVEQGIIYMEAEGGSEFVAAPYLMWTINFYLLLMLPLYCLALCGGMIREELQNETLGYWTTRPVSRWQLLLARFACQALWIQIVAGINAALLIMVGFWRGVPDMLSFAPLLFGVQLLAVLVFGALSTLLGLAARRYMVAGILYGAVVETGIGRIPTNINNLSMTRHLQTLLASHPRVAEAYQGMGWEPERTIQALVILTLAIIIFALSASILFSLKESHHGQEMQK
jgi:ABC-type transport system involved in multi-copper enzyme maturation permease subunit